METMLLSILSISAGPATALVAWLIADARSKSRLSFMEEKVSIFKAESERAFQASDQKLRELELTQAKSEQARQEITNNIEKLDNSKASKEVVEGFRNEVQTLKQDMDKRFDRLERLLEK